MLDQGSFRSRHAGYTDFIHMVSRLVAATLHRKELSYAPPIKLTAIATGLNKPVGIDYHEPTGKVIVSVNYSSGIPHNFELVDQSGAHPPFSTASGFSEEVKIASVWSSPHQGGFTVGEFFTGTGHGGVIARISADGLTVENPWVSLPKEYGIFRGGLFQDRYGVFEGDLIAVTNTGGVWRVKSDKTPTKIVDLGKLHVEGVTTVPNDPTKYGPWAGKIVVGWGNVFIAIKDKDNVEEFDLGITNIEDIKIIPAGAHFFGVEPVPKIDNSGTIWGASPAQFAGMEGDFLVSQEYSPPGLWHVRWDNASGSFQTEMVATNDSSWEQITFVPPRAPLLQYAVKFVCGKSTGEVVAPGVYYTAINVHNPTNEEVRFRKKVAVALPREQPGPVSEFSEAKLGPDQALEIDCPDILRHASTPEEEPADFLKGFVVIESDVELDVVVVYTAAGRDKQVETLDIERVSPRRRRPVEEGLPDLIPVPDPRRGVGFCRLDDRGRLLVTVKNQGTGGAPPSTTTVEFVPGGAFDLPTPAIPVGGSVDLPPLSIPPSCFDPDCSFRIIVDSKNQVVESDKTNNFGSGTCLG